MAGRSKIVVQIVGDSSSLERAFKRASNSSRQLSVGFGTIVKGAVGFAAVTSAINTMSGAVRASIAEFSEQAKVAAQTDAVLKSTAGAAGVTGRQVDKLAASISQLSGIDDEAVQAGENLLLTFPEIRNEVGKGNRVFDQATRAAADLSVAMGIDMKRAALQVGKALNDPARGYSRLQRIGVAFSKGQVEQIKNFVKTGNVVKAQKVIIAELNREFGGSAKALGQTSPGQLNRLRETLRNVGGELIGKLAPAFTTALEAANRFVKRLSAAQGVRAKFNVVFDGIGNIGRQLFEQIRVVLDRVNWAELVTTVQDGLVRGLRNLGGFLDRVDFASIGQQLGDAIARGANGAADFLESVNWGQVGGKIVGGIESFLKGVNWKAVIVGVYRLIVAALRANLALLTGAAKAAGRAIAHGLGEGVRAGLGFVKEQALKVALAIVGALDFKLFVVPGISSLRKKIESELQKIRDAADKTARALAASGKAAAATGNPGTRGTAGSPTRTTTTTTRRPPRVSDQETVAERAASIAAATQKAAEKAAEAARKAREAFDKLLDGLQLGLEKAQITPRLNDDLAALKKIQTALRARLKVERDSIDLQRQIFQNQQEIVGLRTQQQSQTQFKALGLTATGDTPIPGVKALRRQLARMGDAVKGTFLDTGKTRSLIASIRKVLSGGLGKVGDDVRAKIAEMLNGIDQQLKDHGQKRRQRGQIVSTAKLLEGLGLSNDQLKLVRSRINGATSPTRSAAFGRPISSSRGGVAINGPITVVANNPDEMLRAIQRKSRRSAAQSRGQFSGTSLGLR